MRLGRGVGRRWRQRVHGRVALGGGRGLALADAAGVAVVMLERRGLLLKLLLLLLLLMLLLQWLLLLVLWRVEPRRAASARQVRLVVRSHGVLDAGVGIVGVVHGDVAAGVAREGRGDGVQAAGAVLGAGLQRERELRRELRQLGVGVGVRVGVRLVVMLALLVLVEAVGRRRSARRRRRGSNGRQGRGRGVAGSRDGQRRRIVSRWLAVGGASLLSLRVGEPLRIVHGGWTGLGWAERATAKEGRRRGLSCGLSR